jgi:hypothetical protein
MTDPGRRIAALLALLILASHSSTAHAEPQVAQAKAAPNITPRTARAVESALQRAARVWGRAAMLEGGGASSATAVGSGTCGAVLTGEAAAASAGLAHAVVILVASGVALRTHLARSASIARYGNPYGMPSRDIAFPVKGKRTAPLPKPFAVPKPPPAAKEDRGDSRPGRVYATYTRYNRITKRYYSGRTSAVIDLNQPWRAQAEAAVRQRIKNQHADENPESRKSGFRKAELDVYAVGFAVDYTQRYRDIGYLAIRGREQQLIDFHGAQYAQAHGIAEFRGGARSDSAPGERVTENAIRGVARDNPLGRLFHLTANLMFGQLAPYTGHGRFNGKNPQTRRGDLFEDSARRRNLRLRAGARQSIQGVLQLPHG